MDQLQSLDVSVNKAVKSFLREKFSIWYGREVKKQLDSGKAANEVVVDMKLSLVKKASAHWIEEVQGYMKESESIIVNAIANPASSNPPPSNSSSPQDDDCDYSIVVI